MASSTRISLALIVGTALAGLAGCDGHGEVKRNEGTIVNTPPTTVAPGNPPKKNGGGKEVSSPAIPKIND